MTTKDEILRLLNREALTVQELAARLNVTRNAIVQPLRQHEAAGLVRITTTERGDVGFGYDAIFAPNEANGLTFAEMASTAKHAISHRGRAFEALLTSLEQR